MNDLLNIEFVNDKLKKFDDALENKYFQMAQEHGPEDDLLEGLYLQQLEKSTSMQNALALFQSKQIYRGKLRSQIY